jgi:hypothetical protein
VFGKVEKTGTLAPVDLERIQESMKSTIEKAKAEDPRELRKQVAALKKQLVDAQRDKPAATQAKEKIVEKEVLGDRQVKRLESAIERLDGLREKFEAGLAAVRQEASEIKSAIAKVNKLPAAPPARAATPPSPKAPVHMHAHARPMTERASDNGNLGQGEVKILSAAAQYSDVGVDQAQIAVLTGYKETSRRTYLQRLGSRGYIENRGGRIFATSQGIEALGSDYEPLPTGDALRQYWMERLSGGERTILEVLCQNYPDAVTYAALEEVTGYKETSRRTYLQRLGARRLVTSEAGAARASEELFG